MTNCHGEKREKAHTHPRWCRGITSRALSALNPSLHTDWKLFQACTCRPCLHWHHIDPVTLNYLQVSSLVRPGLQFGTENQSRFAIVSFSPSSAGNECRIGTFVSMYMSWIDSKLFKIYWQRRVVSYVPVVVTMTYWHVFIGAQGTRDCKSQQQWRQMQVSKCTLSPRWMLYWHGADVQVARGLRQNPKTAVNAQRWKGFFNRWWFTFCHKLFCSDECIIDHINKWM